MPAAPRQSLLRRLAIDRPAARAWALYDWANSAYYVVVVTAVFPYYFVRVAGAGLPDGEATRRYALVQSASMLVAALLATVLGAAADAAGARKRLLGAFVGLGVAATAAMVLVGRGDWQLAAALVFVGNVGLVGSIVCYEGLLPHVAPEEDLDRLSTTGYAVGYLGGGLLLTLNVAWIRNPGWIGVQDPDSTLPTRLAFLSVAAWWLLFSLPLLLRVPEPPAAREPDEPAGSSAVRNAFARLGETLRGLRAYRHAFLLLVAALVYGEGIGTIIKLAGAYAADLGLREDAVFVALLLTQFVGIPCAVLFGRLAERIGAKRAVHLALWVYVVVCLIGWRMRTEAHFYALAFAVGAVQGGAQALTRSLFARMIPRHESTEFFGLFAFASKVAGFLGPAVFFLVGEATGSNRWAIAAMAAFFLLGQLLLSRVDVAAGRAAARAADAAVARGGPGAGAARPRA